MRVIIYIESIILSCLIMVMYSQIFYHYTLFLVAITALTQYYHGFIIGLSQLYHRIITALSRDYHSSITGLSQAILSLSQHSFNDCNAAEYYF